MVVEDFWVDELDKRKGIVGQPADDVGSNKQETNAYRPRSKIKPFAVMKSLGTCSIWPCKFGY